MDLNQKIIAGLLLAFFLITLVRIFRAPLRLALKLLVNTALGFLALWAVNAAVSRHRHCPGAEPLERAGRRGSGASRISCCCCWYSGSYRVHSPPPDTVALRTAQNFSKNQSEHFKDIDRK